MKQHPNAPLPVRGCGLDPGSPASPASGVTAEGGAGAVPLSASDDGSAVLHTSPPCQTFSRRTSQGDHAGPNSPPLTGSEREHICHVLRLFVILRATAHGLDIADAPKPVRAVHAGRGARLDERDLWIVGCWCGLSEMDLRRAARVAIRAEGGGA